MSGHDDFEPRTSERLRLSRTPHSTGTSSSCAYRVTESCGRFRDVQRYFASRSSSSVTYAAISAFSVRVKGGRGRNGEERRVERERNERTSVLYSLKLERTWQRRGRAPYRACARVPELAARVSKLAFSLSRLQVSDYFGNVGARRPAHSAAAFLRVPLFHASALNSRQHV